jgi:adenine-specific DNA-methyltransferase
MRTLDAPEAGVLLPPKDGGCQKVAVTFPAEANIRFSWSDERKMAAKRGKRSGTKHTGSGSGTRAARQAENLAAQSKADSYEHVDATMASHPDVGTQATFRKKRPAKNYKYDSSLSPSLEWDGQNATVRERGEELIKKILDAETIESAKAAGEELARMSKPFLNWSGKVERLSFDVPTLPLFVHERLSTKAILETVKSHKRDQQESLNLFADPERSVADQLLRSYEHREQWVNRLILGDSMVVMNSLLEYEGLGGQVQMIYIDPPYGVKFGSNFQPFVRKRDVRHNDDADMTREPEMVQAYRDTWELGLHSYLSYLRDRLLVARELLTSSGSIFVQISDENLHHVSELLDEVFGMDNHCSVIAFTKTTGLSTRLLADRCDYLLWYAKDINLVKFRSIFALKVEGEEGATQYDWVHKSSGEMRRRGRDEQLETGDRLFHIGDASAMFTTPHLALPFTLNGVEVKPPANRQWQTTQKGLERLASLNRLLIVGKSLRYVRYLNDFPVVPLNALWTDTGISGFADPKSYVVQTNVKVIARCLLMTTDPGDLVLDPTCGSGTTAYVAEQWGRRWITIDTSRVPLALTRQRLLTATYPWYELKDSSRGPAGGFVYRRKQNNRGEEVGGIVPHITLKSIANDEPPQEEVLVDRPETDNSITRVSGPFVVDATIPTPVDYDGDGIEDSAPEIAANYASFVDRMLEVLRRNPKLQLSGGRAVDLTNIRPPTKSMSISAEAIVDSKPVAITFGPENGAVSDKLVMNAAKEANARNYFHLYVIGFAIQPNARELIDKAEYGLGIAATYVAATPDVLMGDLLKTMRSSQVFSVTGLPDISGKKVPAREKGEPDRYTVMLHGLDSFDPATMTPESIEGGEVPAWFLDTQYNDLSFHVAQAFFPRTGAWENLRKALRAGYEDSVWEHLNGTESAPFEATPDSRIAVKVIDTRGNELMVVKTIGELISKK